MVSVAGEAFVGVDGEGAGGRPAASMMTVLVLVESEACAVGRAVSATPTSSEGASATVRHASRAQQLHCD
jgi:hypothetical protein